MDVIIDGSYTPKQPDMISCGVIIMDKFGFYDEYRFQTKHINASSSFAEWYALECAMNVLRQNTSDIAMDTVIHIYTDDQAIINFMKKRNPVHLDNQQLQMYMHKVGAQCRPETVDGCDLQFHHMKERKQSESITKLHQRAHDKAQLLKHKKKGGLLPVIDLCIKLEPVAKGDRKWVIYENDQPVYYGKIRTILNKYQNERYNIKTLANQQRLYADKGTRRVLRKYIKHLSLR